MAVSGSKFTMADTNAETLGNLLKQLGGLLGVGARSDGRYYLADMCQAGSIPPAQAGGINKWAKYKPFRSDKTSFASDAERDATRKNAMYGLTVQGTTTHPDNNALFIYNSWGLASLDGLPKRIRDFDGYNHAAQDGIYIKGASDYSKGDNIYFEWNENTGDNVMISDILDSPYFSSYTQYELAVIDPFGFIHTERTFSNIDELKTYLNGTSFSFVNIVSEYENQSAASIKQIPPVSGKYWYVSLVAKGATADYKRILLNPLSFLADGSPNPAIYNVLDVSYLTPNTWIGTGYDGGFEIGQLLYKGLTSYIDLSCCSDDSLFIGVTVKNRTFNDMSWSHLYRVVFRIQTNIQTNYYYVDLQKFDGNPLLLEGGETAGTKNGGDGVLWSKGMLSVPLKKIFANQTSDVLSGHMALCLHVGTTYTLDAIVTPWISFTFYNTGEKLANITPKATFPEGYQTIPDLIPDDSGIFD